MLNAKKQPTDVRREIRKIYRDNIELALHAWIPEDIKAAIFYFHGLQSHGGWLWEVGSQFANNGIATFVLDRRGCGISGGKKNEIASADVVINDYITAISTVKQIIGDEVPLILFGHCLGGSFLAAVMHSPLFAIQYDAAIFCSAWLGKLHTTLDEDERLRLKDEKRMDLYDVGLLSSDFTDLKHYQAFIDSDDLAVRNITLHSRSVLLEIESRYLNSSQRLSDIPMVYISGKVDPIVDLEEAYKAFIKFTSGKGTALIFPTDKHYLFFTNARTHFVYWVSAFSLLRELENYA